MMHFFESAKRFLWAFVELAFLAVLSLLLIYLILGKDSGAFVVSVADNVQKFANGIQTPSLIGLAILMVIVLVITRRLKGERTPDIKTDRSPPQP